MSMKHLFLLTTMTPATSTKPMAMCSQDALLGAGRHRAPSTVCSPANKGSKEIVKFQAGYIFWKAV